MGFLFVCFFLAFNCVNASDLFCRRLRAQCVPSESCGGKKFNKIPCDNAANVCCFRKKEAPKIVTTTLELEPESTTVGTTLKPAIKANNLPIENCGINKYYDIDMEERIIGGYESKVGKWPWLVSLRDDGDHQCGGSIINRQWILTAAHCFKKTQNPSSWTVVAGEHDQSVDDGSEVEVGVNRIFMPNYDSLTKINDIALLLLDEPLPDRDDSKEEIKIKDGEGASKSDFGINEICLPKPDDLIREGTTCALMGWGKLNNGNVAAVRLQEISVPILNLDLCVSKYNKTVNGVRNQNFQPYLIDHSQICAGDLNGNKDTCQGDSGGPLTCRRADGRFFIAGLTSYSIGCGYRDVPGVYTNVAAHLRWIEETMKANTGFSFHFL